MGGIGVRVRRALALAFMLPDRPARSSEKLGDIQVLAVEEQSAAALAGELVSVGVGVGPLGRLGRALGGGLRSGGAFVLVRGRRIARGGGGILCRSRLRRARDGRRDTHSEG